MSVLFFFVFVSATTEFYTLSLHDALPILLLFVPHVVGGRSCGETQASSEKLVFVTPCSELPLRVTKSALPANCPAMLIFPATPAAGQLLPEHVPLLPCPEASTKLVAPAASSKCSSEILPLGTGAGVGVGVGGGVGVGVGVGVGGGGGVGVGGP